MVSLKDMAEGYIKQLIFRVEESEKELLQLKQHLEECINEIQFGADEGCCKTEEKNGGEMVSTVPLNSEQHGVVDQEAT
tara:strand:+ start:1429 stop:1665 length:237 start_codon:yes stop_codon:yes gene_type:complete